MYSLSREVSSTQIEVENATQMNVVTTNDEKSADAIVVISNYDEGLNVSKHQTNVVSK
jgi:hypothetical protein